MSSIAGLSNSAYYQLSNSSGGAGNAATAIPSLANILSGASSTSNSASPDSAYLLDLSPQAQQYMSGGGITANTASSSSAGSFTLSTQQQQALTAIIAKYKDAPYTQATFNSMQNDLEAAGIGADQLTGKDQAHNFNPTELLVDDLNGNTDAANALVASTSTSAEQTKSTNYMQSVIQQWQQVSTAYSAQSTSVTPTGSAAGA